MTHHIGTLGVLQPSHYIDKLFISIIDMIDLTCGTTMDRSTPVWGRDPALWHPRFRRIAAC